MKAAIQAKVMADVACISDPNLNRIDESVVFHALGREHVREIAASVDGFEARLAERDLQLSLDTDVMDYVVGQGLIRCMAPDRSSAIQRLIETPLAGLCWR